MKAGFSCRDITPKVPCYLAGFHRTGPAVEIHDPLFVRTLWLDDGVSRSLIVALDLLFFDTPRWELYEHRLQEAFGLRPDEVITNMSHSHTGPCLSRWNYNGYIDEEYINEVERLTIECAREAERMRVPVTLTAGNGVNRVPVSRRKINAAGEAMWLPDPTVKICDATPFLCLRDAAQQIVALLFSVSCHPSMVDANIVSAEFPGAAVRQLNERYGTKGAMFMQGAGGDAKPEPCAKGGEWLPCTWEDVEVAGSMAIEPIVAALEAGRVREVAGTLRSVRTAIELPLAKPPSSTEFERMLLDVEMRAERRLWASEMYYRLLLVNELPTAVPVEMSLLTIGGIFHIVGVQGELVADLGNQIIAEFAGSITMPMGYTHGVQAYIPGDRQLAEHGYEVDSYWEYHWPAPLAGGIDARIKNGLQALQRG